MDALLKGLLARGYRVSSGPVVEILGHSVRFSICEEIDSVEQPPEEYDLSGSYKFSYKQKKVRRSPSGRLVVSIDTSGFYNLTGLRKSWADGKKQRIENCIDGVIEGLILFAGRMLRDQAESAEQEEQRPRVVHA